MSDALCDFSGFLGGLGCASRSTAGAIVTAGQSRSSDISQQLEHMVACRTTMVGIGGAYHTQRGPGVAT
jgi:uncharacterized iron-regulated protein